MRPPGSPRFPTVDEARAAVPAASPLEEPLPDERSVVEGRVRRRKFAQDMAMRAPGAPACDEVGESGSPVSTGVGTARTGIGCPSGHVCIDSESDFGR
ncbi:hypothetical protein ACIF80_16510 [Streptomyces sp. NPDC085927]|uniref:hypothetical protein n=1 Tax=Streptomyces sp. NPDC085927 TaxID=3365738 RepID=UPI0037D02612